MENINICSGIIVVVMIGLLFSLVRGLIIVLRKHYKKSEKEKGDKTLWIRSRKHR